MAIMCLACVFSFWVGKNVGTVQALKDVDTEVAVMENVEPGTVEESEAMSDTSEDKTEENIESAEVQENEGEELPEEELPLLGLEGAGAGLLFAPLCCCSAKACSN